MDRFDLNWPKTDAVFYTDGWRCRIVWRQKGGIGGTIDNNVQCMRRVAESLEGAPYLLSAIKARGHARLAAMIEAEQPEVQKGAEGDESPQQNAEAKARPVRVARKDADDGKLSTRDRIKATSRPSEARAPERRAPKAAPKTALKAAPKADVKAAARPSAGAAQADRLKDWLKHLDGDASWEAASNRRAKLWHELGRLGDEALQLKPPAANGKQEWVLKRSWPDDGKRKAEYVAAANFRGVAAYLLKAKADAAFVEGLFKALSGADHAELKSAAEAWRKSSGGQTH
ncbi:MAG: hypothetical protein AAGE43_01680 [Pseudomonadota bacterium]